MKNWIYIFIIGLMGSLVSSCQQSLDDEVQLPVTSGKAQITFTIALDDIDSRAAWEDNEEAEDAVVGTEIENQIDLGTEDGLQVFVYDLQGNHLGEVTNKEIRKVDDRTYSFNGQLEIDNLQGSTLPCRLEVYANCIGSNETFGYNVDYIPMWGTKEAELQLAKGELTKLTEPIYLLRAMAKVEVKLDASIVEDFDITSVSVDKYNETGNVLPSYTKLMDTEDMVAQSVFRPYASLVNNALPFAEVVEDVFIVYLPEYDNSSNPATISLTIDGKPYTIEFKNYVEGSATGDAYDIVRNHYYQYVITSVKSGLNLRLSVVPWTVNEDEMSYTETVGYTVKESGLGWININNGSNKNNVYLNTGSNVDAAGFKVKLISPYGAKWMAVLEDAQDKFTFDTGAGFSGKIVDGSTKTIEGNIGNDIEGTIVTLGIKAKDSSEVGEYSAKLRLYVQLETGKWFEIDLIDGNVDNGVENYIINHSKSSV